MKTETTKQPSGSDKVQALVGCMNDAFCVLESTPDIQLDWNEEMQIRAKEGIVSAMKTLLDGMKLYEGESHKGNPCVKCGIPHDDVAIGKCKPNVKNEGLTAPEGD